jgi:hypothetical protein
MGPRLGFPSSARAFGALGAEATLALSFTLACLIDSVAGRGVQSLGIQTSVIELFDDT